MRWAVALPVAVSIAMPVQAQTISVAKTVTIVSDPIGNLVPRSLPGSVADYRTLATNPSNNVFRTVRNIVLVEALPATVDLRVSDLSGSGSGPVEFADGNLLGTGLLSSGLGYTYSPSNPTTDSTEFFDGTTWSYQPVPDADGYDRNVRAMRITLSSTFVTATSFQLRYRVKIR